MAHLLRPSNRNKIPWLFTDFSLTKFSFSLTKILWFYDIFIFSQPINDRQIPFTSSLKCTSLILQMKQIKSLNSFLAQNVLKLTSFHSFEWAREKINTFSTFQAVKYQLQHIFWAKIMKFPDFSLTFLVFKISLTFPWPWRKIKFPWLIPEQWPPWGWWLWQMLKLTCIFSVHLNVHRILFRWPSSITTYLAGEKAKQKAYPIFQNVEQWVSPHWMWLHCSPVLLASKIKSSSKFLQIFPLSSA